MNALLFLLLFTGNYSGKGQAVFSSGRIYDCKEIFLSIETTSAQFKLKDGGYKCGDLLHASFDPFHMTIREGKLFDGNTELGTISEKELKYEIFDPEDGSTYRLKLIYDSNRLQYFEEWYDGEKIALKINGLLSPLK